ncbi:MAG TPA: response regulator, partial [Blastocatellia bacterium]|nr:response regulator [Blastocatellia bacterium]
LDVMLPGLNGFEALRRIRRSERSAYLPVLMLTARGEDVDRIVGLELGPTITCPSRSTRANSSRAFAPSCAAPKNSRRRRPKSFPSAMSNWTGEPTAHIALGSWSN